MNFALTLSSQQTIGANSFCATRNIFGYDCIRTNHRARVGDPAGSTCCKASEMDDVHYLQELADTKSLILSAKRPAS
ncbi:MAG: hypothetical protein NWT08_00935, partial [Akkermansiaceae bacterium]|nr:hypothetical protein [Akkermansiaceae bacterium]MDP4997032.1 hypothetical protein [Akkermansiaceae bacterium]